MRLDRVRAKVGEWKEGFYSVHNEFSGICNRGHEYSLLCNLQRHYKYEHFLNIEEYEELLIDPVKMATYREKYGYTGHDRSCLFCGEEMGKRRTRHMKLCHPGVPVETEKGATTVVNTATKLYKPTKPRLRGVSNGAYKTRFDLFQFDMNIMRKLRRDGYFKNSMLDEIEAESRIPESFKNRLARKQPEIKRETVYIEANDSSSDDSSIFDDSRFDFQRIHKND